WGREQGDLLRCATCRALLASRALLAGDLRSYRERCEELRQSLRSAHERFCFWPDSPCPDRFALLLVDEPQVLLQEFLERFRSLCQLELQLPSLRPEDLRHMALPEERLAQLLQLLEDELELRAEGERRPGKVCPELLPVHAVPACVLALCGWNCSAGGSVNLSVISCSRCMRKVGLWAFHQLESAAPEPDSCGSTPAPSERGPPVPTSPRRMLTRSQDTLPAGSEQHEKSPSPSVSRPRGWDSPNSVDRAELEVSSPTLRSRPVTRSMGQGDNMEVPSSPIRRAKRARLCSSSSSDTSTRSFFHPTSQHRDWCPWVCSAEGQESLEDVASHTEQPGNGEPGWQVVLNTLLGTRKRDTVPDTEPVSLSEKSCKVFRIFRQWESMNSS
ncbi:NIPA protein, partial [Sclerurus mexicanus]|nr:NIPA protein [Sclerurus mexicanus]